MVGRSSAPNGAPRFAAAPPVDSYLSLFFPQILFKLTFESPQSLFQSVSSAELERERERERESPADSFRSRNTTRTPERRGPVATSACASNTHARQDSPKMSLEKSDFFGRESDSGSCSKTSRRKRSVRASAAATPRSRARRDVAGISTRVSTRALSGAAVGAKRGIDTKNEMKTISYFEGKKMRRKKNHDNTTKKPHFHFKKKN